MSRVGRVTGGWGGGSYGVKWEPWGLWRWSGWGKERLDGTEQRDLGLEGQRLSCRE